MTQIQPVIFGEVLFDCFPDQTEVLGGAPFNVAWHLQAFGLSPLLISRVGDDQRGVEIREAMTRWHMDTQYIQIDGQRPTGTVKIHLENNEATFTISPDEAYGHIEQHFTGLSPKVPLLYHGTLALWNPSTQEVINTFKRQYHPQIFIDVNLRPPWWERDRVLALLEGAAWVKLNEEELHLLSPGQDTPAQKVDSLLTDFQLQALLLTKGKNGAEIFLQDGSRLDIAPGPQIPVVDTVGAGDAFSAVFIFGMVSGWPIPKTLSRAQEFASSIVGQRGATVSDRNFYAPFIKRWATV